jgi:hypothetical protein
MGLIGEARSECGRSDRTVAERYQRLAQSLPPPQVNQRGIDLLSHQRAKARSGQPHVRCQSAVASARSACVKRGSIASGGSNTSAIRCCGMALSQVASLLVNPLNLRSSRPIVQRSTKTATYGAELDARCGFPGGTATPGATRPPSGCSTETRPCGQITTFQTGCACQVATAGDISENTAYRPEASMRRSLCSRRCSALGETIGPW